jgi:hypothetical protein
MIVPLSPLGTTQARYSSSQMGQVASGQRCLNFLSVGERRKTVFNSAQPMQALNDVRSTSGYLTGRIDGIEWNGSSRRVIRQDYTR